MCNCDFLDNGGKFQHGFTSLIAFEAGALECTCSGGQQQNCVVSCLLSISPLTEFKNLPMI